MFPTYRRRLVFALSCCGWVSSCATPPSPRVDSVAHTDAGATEVTGVPFHPQETWQCGPAALAMVLGWSGESVPPQALVGEVYSPARKGSLQASMVAAARRHDRVAFTLSGPADLTRELEAGNPVIVLQNLGLSWVPVWHYAVAIGYDGAANTVTLHTGTSEAKRLSATVFDNTWARSGYWGLLVLPPGRVPATAGETAYLRAVEGLEQAGRQETAATAYQGALTRWPGSLGALVGMANTRYASGDLPGAESALRAATRHHPGSGIAYNNLAQVLSDQGRHAEALAVARRAVESGGSYSQDFNDTLKEIVRRRGSSNESTHARPSHWQDQDHSQHPAGQP
ncbi:MAG: PA2778 family cysteine peptidase [Pseudomonadota bacterium]|nr:PA2778 family cysteine peptidase [Pseudomonadota bacterium]